MSSFIVFRILCVNLSLGFKNLNLYNIFKITSRHKYLVNGNAYEIVAAQLNKPAENEINTQTGFCKIHCLCKINKKKTNIQVLKFVRLNKMAVFLGTVFFATYLEPSHCVIKKVQSRSHWRAEFHTFLFPFGHIYYC